MITLTTAPEISEMIEQMKLMQLQFGNLRKMYSQNSNRMMGSVTKKTVIEKCVIPAFDIMWGKIINDFARHFQNRSTKWNMIVNALKATYAVMRSEITRFVTFEADYDGKNTGPGSIQRRKTFLCHIMLIDIVVLDDQDKKMQIANLYLRPAGEVVVKKKNKKGGEKIYRYPISPVMAYPDYKAGSSSRVPLWRILFNGAKATRQFEAIGTKPYGGTVATETGYRQRRGSANRTRLLFHKDGSNQYFFGKSGSRGARAAMGSNVLFEAQNIIRQAYKELFNSNFAILFNRLMEAKQNKFNT